MEFQILALGKWKKGPEKDLFETYCKRMRPKPSLIELDVKKKLNGPALVEAQADLLLDHIEKGSVIIALDERGKNLTSREFASKLEKFEDQGRAHFTCIIGGADGLHEKIRSKADILLGLGQMTWPHMLVRVLIAEQLFRAQSILSGHPYHRD